MDHGLELLVRLPEAHLSFVEFVQPQRAQYVQTAQGVVFTLSRQAEHNQSGQRWARRPVEVGH